MKFRAFSITLGIFFIFTFHLSAQSISLVITNPINVLILNTNMPVAAVVPSSTYQIQSVQARIGTQTVDLVYTNAAYSYCMGGNLCYTQAGWAGVMPMAGLPRGTNLLIVTAVDVFGNSNSVQREVWYYLRPILQIASPGQYTVVRNGQLPVSITTTNNSVNVAIEVREGGEGGPVLASGVNSLNTTLTFPPNYEGKKITLLIRGTDSPYPGTYIYRHIYFESSTNLAEIANVSGGWIIDVDPERLMFNTIDNDKLPADYWISSGFKIKSRTDGSEATMFYDPNTRFSGGVLVPNGAAYIVDYAIYPHSSPALYLNTNGTPLLLGTHANDPIDFLVRKGDFLAWGWYTFDRVLKRTDLRNTTTVQVTAPVASFDLATNGNVAFAQDDSYGSHAIYFWNGTPNLQTNIPGGQFTNQLTSPKTDGSNIFYIHVTPTNQMLQECTATGLVTVAQGTAIAGYEVNNGWVAYLRTANGQTHLWRRAPDGTATQLTFFGTPTTLLALAPNGEVALYNSTNYYLSKGTWPPSKIVMLEANLGLKVFWQDGWLATLGRSLFQVFPNSPQFVAPHLSGNVFKAGRTGQMGQTLITEFTTNLNTWTPLETNIVNGSDISFEHTLTPESSSRLYRLRALP